MKVFVEQLVVRGAEFDDSGPGVRPFRAADGSGRELTFGRPPRRQDLEDRDSPTGLVDDINDGARDIQFRGRRKSKAVNPRPRL